MAKALQVPFYVAVESYKFARMYPLSQRDVTDLTVVPDLLASVNAPLSASHHTSQGQGHNCIIKPNFSLVIPSPSKLKRSFTDLASSLPANVEVEQQGIDFTPANCITLLFTDIGVLTPAAVSDELIRLYQ